MHSVWRYYADPRKIPALTHIAHCILRSLRRVSTRKTFTEISKIPSKWRCTVAWHANKPAQQWHAKSPACCRVGITEGSGVFRKSIVVDDGCITVMKWLTQKPLLWEAEHVREAKRQDTVNQFGATVGSMSSRFAGMPACIPLCILPLGLGVCGAPVEEQEVWLWFPPQWRQTRTLTDREKPRAWKNQRRGICRIFFAG